MATSASKRFYIELLIWALGNLLLFALSYAGVINDNLEARVYIFILGGLVLFMFLHPSVR